MPSKTILKKKEQMVSALAEKLQNSVCGVLVNYKGINVADDTKLRKTMREAGVSYSVVKNSILSRAFEKAGLSELNVHLTEETAIALSDQDIIIAPKLTYGQVEASKGAYTIKAGFIEGKAVDSVTIIEYAKLPSKEVLISKLLFMLQSPMQRLAIAISEIAKKDGEVPEAAPAETAAAPEAPAEEVAEVAEVPAEEAVAEAPAEEAVAEVPAEEAVAEVPAEEVADPTEVPTEEPTQE